jgi:hypothetical protein
MSFFEAPETAASSRAARSGPVHPLYLILTGIATPIFRLIR